MTDPLFIPQSQTGTLWLFHLNPANPQARILAEAPTDATIAASLGLPSIPPGSAEVIRLADISALGLRGFLLSGHDVRADALGPGTESLDTLCGHVLIVPSRIAALGDVTLHPGPGLVPLGAFTQATAAPARLQTPEPERPGTQAHPSPQTPAPRTGAAAVVLVLALVAVALAFVLFGVVRWPN